MATLLTDIRRFMGVRTLPPGVEFCIPHFACSGDGHAQLPTGEQPGFVYPSWTVAERDVRSAIHVLNAVTPAGSFVKFTEPDEFIERRPNGHISFVFGSRSNRAVAWLLERTRKPNLVRFKFDDVWTIIGSDNKEFSIPDPSKLSRKEYTELTDYGVVARLSLRDRDEVVFVVAGLGGRATEGCGAYLSRTWASLHREFGRNDFAIVLAFPPPVTPENAALVASYSADL